MPWRNRCDWIWVVVLTAGLGGMPRTCGAADGAWISLFDGETLAGWEATENPDTFRVVDGVIVAKGPRSHLFYTGSVGEHDFRNFELEMDVLTKQGANSGIYFHTTLQESGWPEAGYEMQINHTHRDWRKTGSLYNVQNVRKPDTEDDVWFRCRIRVEGRRIVLQVNGRTVVDYTETDEAPHLATMPGRRLGHGTIALQGHDPGSEVHFRAIRIRLLP